MFLSFEVCPSVVHHHFCYTSNEPPKKHALRYMYNMNRCRSEISPRKWTLVQFIWLSSTFVGCDRWSWTTERSKWMQFQLTAWVLWRRYRPTVSNRKQIIMHKCKHKSSYSNLGSMFLRLPCCCRHIASYPLGICMCAKSVCGMCIWLWMRG